jgi:hypothetical protein
MTGMPVKVYKIYDVNGGTPLTEKIEFIQKPYVRAIGNPVFPDASRLGEAAGARLDPAGITIDQLVEPISYLIMCTAQPMTLALVSLTTFRSVFSVMTG